MREFGVDGTLLSTGIIEDKGFKKGDAIVRKADNMVGTIKEMFSNNVVLHGEDGQDYTLPTHDLLSGAWKHQTASKPHVPVSKPEAWKEMLAFGIIKAKVVQEIDIAVTKHNMVQELELFQKPKDVIAKDAIKKGKCLCLPISTKVELREDGDPAPLPPQALHIGSQKHDACLFLVQSRLF